MKLAARFLASHLRLSSSLLLHTSGGFEYATDLRRCDGVDGYFALATAIDAATPIWLQLRPRAR